MGRIINKVATRKFILTAANELTPSPVVKKMVDSAGREWDYSRCLTNVKKFTSVSQEYIDSIDAEVRNLIVSKLKTSPPRGKTVK